MPCELVEEAKPVVVVVVVVPEPANPNPPSFIAAAADMEGPEAAAAENSTIKNELRRVINQPKKKNTANGRAGMVTNRNWMKVGDGINSAGGRFGY